MHTSQQCAKPDLVAREAAFLKSFMGEDAPVIGRFWIPEDLGKAARLLCSDEASMIIGACTGVDDGRCT
jgi:NAD(P)-dependent dehydrogenase (short-subunit alcohol dehydrogenase family)